MAEFTPMMKQYLEVKEKCKDCILFFRLGDFYEMFFEDAQTASRELELVLTGRDCGMDQRAPMCGIPYHAALSYISRLINKGYKVAVCEQMENPANAVGIVKRDIIRVYTPGTVTEDQLLNQKSNNYILSVYSCKNMYGVAAADISTGELHTTSITIGNTLNKLLDEVARYSPSEIIINSDADNIDILNARLSGITSAYIGAFDKENYDFSLSCEKLTPYLNKQQKITKYDFSVNAAGALIAYVESAQKVELKNILHIDFYATNDFLILDAASRRNLEITETLRDKNKRGSLLWVLDKTVTSMGGRTLKKWIEQPLVDLEEINKRLDAVGEFKDKFMVRSELRELMEGIYDIERLTGKIVLGTVNARDLVSLRQSLGQIPYVVNILKNCECAMLQKELGRLDLLTDIFDLLSSSINDEPPITIKDGGIIKEGYNKEIDECTAATRDGKKWLADLEARERTETGIKNLKIGYNSVFGYFIEVTKMYLNLVPDRYIRKQTLVNNERYITDELKKMEDTILGAEDKLTTLEYDQFIQIRETVALQVERLKSTAYAISCLDAIASLAEVADREGYTKPLVNNDEIIEINEGRHPVVEHMMPGNFVPNDVLINSNDDSMLVITGPNMAGKSTYMRQVALIVLMAQAGSFVPADSAKIGVVDRIFTRVGASDDLASGQSTFMVEMTEVANILTNATSKSLLILDEIGRGTSTFDGLSIAWAVLEYISGNIKSRTMFATHYHELTELEGQITGVKNYCIAVKKNGDEIIFIRKVKRGGADRSYGIAVAALAGIPKSVTVRAKEILATLEEQDISHKEIKSIKRQKASADNSQFDLFSFTANTAAQDEIVEELKTLDVQSMTPIEALNVLYSLKQKAMLRK